MTSHKTLLQLDVNGTIVASDQASGYTPCGGLCVALAYVYWTKGGSPLEWTFSLVSLGEKWVSFYQYHKDKMTDEEFKEFITGWARTPKYIRAAYGRFKKMFRDLVVSPSDNRALSPSERKSLTVQDVSNTGEDTLMWFVQPSFWHGLDYLRSNPLCNLAIVFRTFGNDFDQVLGATKLYTEGRVPGTSNPKSLTKLEVVTQRFQVQRANVAPYFKIVSMDDKKVVASGEECVRIWFETRVPGTVTAVQDSYGFWEDEEPDFTQENRNDSMQNQGEFNPKDGKPAWEPRDGMGMLFLDDLADITVDWRGEQSKKNYYIHKVNLNPSTLRHNYFTWLFSNIHSK